MKKLLAISILACIFLSPALTSSAAAHDYDYVYTDVNIITPDSFEDIFSETEADRAAFTYEMATLNSSRAVVAMEIELKVGSDYYTTIVSGDIPAYTLPSGDTLYEGPISGTMTVSEDEYRVTAGFTKLESTGGVLVSITMQGDSKKVAFYFGDNIIHGEVMEFFVERANFAKSMNNNSDASNLADNLNTDYLNNGNSASPCIVGPGFAPITHPGDSGGELPSIGNAIFEDLDIVKHDNNAYLALQTRAYWDESRNHLVVEVIPYSIQTQNYAETLSQYEIPPVVSLSSINVSLDLQYDIPLENYGEITNLQIPDVDSYTDDSAITGNLLLSNIFYDVLSFFNLFSNTAEYILSKFEGGIIKDENNDSLHNGCTINISYVAPDPAVQLDNIENLLLFRYTLARANSNTYLGGTPYKVTTNISYLVVEYEKVNEYINIPSYSTIEKSSILWGTVDIQ